MSPRRLTRRQLNRATLARQLLLRRSDQGPLEAVRHLVGLQAQAPFAPYHALLCRLEGFAPDDLGQLLLDRRLVRAVTMRGTIHLMAPADAAAVRPHLQPLLDRQITGQKDRREALAGVDLDAVAAAGAELLAPEPLTVAELGARLAERFPGVPADALATVVRGRLATVQTPPRAVWGRQGTPTLAPLDAWVAGGPNPEPLPGPMPLAELVRRYLAAFGPASVKDVQTWSGLTRLGEVVDAMAPELEAFVDDDGVALWDLPDAPRPDPDEEAPVRLLAEFDELLLGHHDRRRVIPEAHRPRLATLNGVLPATVLVDGEVAGWWRIRRARATKGAPALATLELEPWGRLPAGTRPALRTEAERVLAAVAPGEAHAVRVVRP